MCYRRATLYPTTTKSSRWFSLSIASAVSFSVSQNPFREHQSSENLFCFKAVVLFLSFASPKNKASQSNFVKGPVKLSQFTPFCDDIHLFDEYFEKFHKLLLFPVLVKNNLWQYFENKFVSSFWTVPGGADNGKNWLFYHYKNGHFIMGAPWRGGIWE